MNVNVNFGFRAIMMCQSRLINFNKCIAMVRDLDSGEKADYGLKIGSAWGTLHFLPNLAMDLKLF